MRNNPLDRKDHSIESRMLHLVAIQCGPHLQFLRIRNRVRVHQRWSNRGKCVETLSMAELSRDCLGLPRGNIVRSGVTKDIVESLVVSHIVAFFADDDAEFDFEISVCHKIWNHNGSTGIVQSGIWFEKHDWYGRDSEVQFCLFGGEQIGSALLNTKLDSTPPTDVGRIPTPWSV